MAHGTQGPKYSWDQGGDGTQNPKAVGTISVTLHTSASLSSQEIPSLLSCPFGGWGMAIWRPVVCVLIGQPHAENRFFTSHVTVSRRETLRWTYPKLRAVMEEGEGTIQVKSFGSVSGQASLEGTHYISPLLSIRHILALTNCLLCARHYLG